MLWFTATILPISCLATWIFNGSGESVPVVTLFHIAVNLADFVVVLPRASGESVLLTTTVITALVVGVIWWRRRANRAPAPENPPNVVDVIASLFETHGIPTARDGETILLSEQGCTVEASIVDEKIHATGRTCELEFRMHLPDGRTLIECFAGVGESTRAATEDALQNFTRSSFHVVLRALLAPAPDDQVDVETWLVGDNKYEVTLGSVVGRGPSPAFKVPTSWFPALEETIKQASLSGDLYWIRFYYGHLNNETAVVEVLLNNEKWISAERRMAALNWPESEAFYSVRLFLVLRRAA